MNCQNSVNKIIYMVPRCEIFSHPQTKKNPNFLTLAWVLFLMEYIIKTTQTVKIYHFIFLMKNLNQKILRTFCALVMTRLFWHFPFHFICINHVNLRIKTVLPITNIKHSTLCQEQQIMEKNKYLTLKCHMEVNETILKMPWCQQKYNENKIDILPFLGELGPNFHILAHWPKIRKIHISSVVLTFYSSMRPFWKYLIVIKTLVRTELKFYPF